MLSVAANRVGARLATPLPHTTVRPVHVHGGSVDSVQMGIICTAEGDGRISNLAVLPEKFWL